LEIFIQLLIEEVKFRLPGEAAHLPMSPIYRRKSSEALLSAKNYKESAVAIHLFPYQDGISGILIQRPSYDGVHSGQIAFPGGKKEDEDINLEYTARRESFEEVGIPINQGELIGELTQVYIPVSNFLVFPFVIFHEKEPELLLDSREVESVLYFDLNELLDDSKISEMPIYLKNQDKPVNVPCFDFYGKYIWGATALILNEFKEIVKRIR
jgi:8-oxo-dGTP pyrophosphatase MutT (NUDIX family)